MSGRYEYAKILYIQCTQKDSSGNIRHYTGYRINSCVHTRSQSCSIDGSINMYETIVQVSVSTVL